MLCQCRSKLLQSARVDSAIGLNGRKVFLVLLYGIEGVGSQWGGAL